jgi:3-deoxy-D-manno-octulosonic-acid transferase
MADVGERLLGGYARLTGYAASLGRLIVSARRRSGKEHPERWRERIGIAGIKPQGETPFVWIHAASVGETVAVLPLVTRLTETGLKVVLTTVTITAAAMIERKLPPGVVHQFVPLDIAPFVDRFLDTWKPQLAIFVESEVWPVTIQRLSLRNIPLVVSNARMSERSLRGWSRVPSLSEAIFGRIRLCLAQSEADAARFATLGTGRVQTVGNIKFDAPAPEASRSSAAALAAAIGDRPVWLAASTHPGEDEIVLDAYEHLLDRLPRLLLILAPRHPRRGVDIMNMAVSRQLDVCQRSAGALPSRGTSVYVADTVGELGTFCRLATVAFMGGSLVAHGGHNPIEPGRARAAVITGPHVGNFSDIYAALFAESGASVVADLAELGGTIEYLIRHAVARERQVEAALAVIARFTGALDRTWDALEPTIAPLVLAARVAKQGGRP